MASVKTGLDLFFEKKMYENYRGKKIGIITNHTGRNADGKSILDLFDERKELRVVALFSPEHGMSGSVHAGEVPSSCTTGRPVYSLYGKTKRPTAAMLEGIDVLIYDIQDLGTRSYTYATTLFFAMEEAAKSALRAMLDAEIDKQVKSIEIASVAEIGKAQLGGFLSFGLTLLAIPAIAAAATVAKTLLYGIMGGFAEGGFVGAGGSRLPFGSGGMVATGAPALVMAHEGEAIGTPSALTAAGIGGVNIIFNNYGALSSRIDIEEIGAIIGEKVKASLKGAI